MTTDPLSQVSTRATPQSERADQRQVLNSAGGWTFAVDDLTRLRRFLTLGVEGGTYYVAERELTRDNADVVLRLARDRTTDLVREVVAVSEAGRAPRHQPGLFALAAAFGLGDLNGRRAAESALPRVARTGTHLLQFVRYAEQFRGWGRLLKRAVGAWYLDLPVDRLAYQVVKYRQREGWSHRDVLRVAHPRPATDDAARRALLDWTTHANGWDATATYSVVNDYDALRLVTGYERARRVTCPETLALLVREYRLPWEALPDAALGHREVWDALVDGNLPLGALLRQLPRLTRLGLLPPLGGRTADVIARLTDGNALRRARVHPFQVLVAQRTYASGSGYRSSQTWEPSRPVVDALDAAFYASYGAVQPTGRRLLLALDVSGSMTAPLGRLPLTAREATGALALVTAATEPTYEVVAFSAGTRTSRGAWTRGSGSSRWGLNFGLTPVTLSPRQRLDDALRALDALPFGGTDCALPMLYALDRGLEVDAFVIYTDNETWAGNVHPYQALRRYREATGIPARLVVVAMTSTGFTIADPADAGTLDVVGLDAAVPALVNDFARGDLVPARTAADGVSAVGS